MDFEIGVWNSAGEEEHAIDTTTWQSKDPEFASIAQTNIINQILDEICKWEKQEMFKFSIYWNDENPQVSDPHTIAKLLKILCSFLRRSLKSFDEAIQEMLSWFVQSEQHAVDYMWWLLGRNPIETMDQVVLGDKLASQAKEYGVARARVHSIVESYSCLGTPPDQDIQLVLVDIHEQTQYARLKFEVYKASLVATKLRRMEHHPRASSMLSKTEIRERLMNLNRNFNVGNGTLMNGHFSTFTNHGGASASVTSTATSFVSQKGYSCQGDPVFSTSPVLNTLLIRPHPFYSRSSSSSSDEDVRKALCCTQHTSSAHVFIQGQSHSSSDCLKTSVVGSLGSSPADGDENDSVFPSGKPPSLPADLVEVVSQLFPGADLSSCDGMLQNILSISQLVDDCE